MAHKRATMLDAITLKVPEWLASDSIEADIVTMIRVAESYRQNLAAVTRDAHGNPRPTRLEAARAARKAGFDINELLENILVHLPARELFRNQRVSKNFKETIEKSVKIQEKQFLKTKPNEPVFKTMVCGYQQPAAMSNTLFAPLKPLAERASSGINVHGLTLTHPAYFTLESSLMKTFLMDTSCTLKAMSFELSIGGCEPYIFVGFDNLVVRGTWTVGDIFHEILSLQCYMPIISKGAAEEHREQSEWCPIWWTSLTNAWADPKTPTLDRRPDVMRYELSCTADSRNKFWRFNSSTRHESSLLPWILPSAWRSPSAQLRGRCLC